MTGRMPKYQQKYYHGTLSIEAIMGQSRSKLCCSVIAQEQPGLFRPNSSFWEPRRDENAATDLFQNTANRISSSFPSHSCGVTNTSVLGRIYIVASCENSPTAQVDELDSGGKRDYDLDLECLDLLGIV